MTPEIRQKVKELEQIRQKQILAASEIKALHNAFATANANYENAKNKFLIELYAEEAEQGVKRTEKQREALYRTKFQDLRFARELKKQEVEAERSYIQLLGQMQMNLQTQLNLEKAESYD